MKGSASREGNRPSDVGIGCGPSPRRATVAGPPVVVMGLIRRCRRYLRLIDEWARVWFHALEEISSGSTPSARKESDRNQIQSLGDRVARGGSRAPHGRGARWFQKDEVLNEVPKDHGTTDRRGVSSCCQRGADGTGSIHAEGAERHRVFGIQGLRGVASYCSEPGEKRKRPRG
jgi:hypothetical protein